MSAKQTFHQGRLMKVSALFLLTVDDAADAE
jgi:hypothetical protein